MQVQFEVRKSASKVHVTSPSTITGFFGSWASNGVGVDALVIERA
jgi:hypothetical protein